MTEYWNLQWGDFPLNHCLLTIAFVVARSQDFELSLTPLPPLHFALSPINYFSQSFSKFPFLFPACSLFFCHLTYCHYLSSDSCKISLSGILIYRFFDFLSFILSLIDKLITLKFQPQISSSSAQKPLPTPYCLIS